MLKGNITIYIHINAAILYTSIYKNNVTNGFSMDLIISYHLIPTLLRVGSYAKHLLPLRGILMCHVRHVRHIQLKQLLPRA